MDVKIIRVDARGANKDERTLKGVNDEVKFHLLNSVMSFNEEIHIVNITNDKGEVYYVVITAGCMYIYYDNSRRYEAVKDTIKMALPTSYYLIGSADISYAEPNFDLKNIITGNKYLRPSRLEYMGTIVDRYKSLCEIE